MGRILREGQSRSGGGPSMSSASLSDIVLLCSAQGLRFPLVQSPHAGADELSQSLM